MTSNTRNTLRFTPSRNAITADTIHRVVPGASVVCTNPSYAKGLLTKGMTYTVVGVVHDGATRNCMGGGSMGLVLAGLPSPQGWFACTRFELAEGSESPDYIDTPECSPEEAELPSRVADCDCDEVNELADEATIGDSGGHESDGVDVAEGGLRVAENMAVGGLNISINATEEGGITIRITKQ